MVSIVWDEDLHRFLEPWKVMLFKQGKEDRVFDSIKEYYWRKGYDPQKTLLWYYDERENIFFEPDMCGGLEPIYDVYRTLDPWKIMLFKKNGDCIFIDRTNSFLVELIWLPF